MRRSKRTEYTVFHYFHKIERNRTTDNGLADDIYRND